MKKSVKTGFNYKVFIACLVLVFLSAFLGSIFSGSTTKSEWYQNIKPSITPPNWVFPVVWNILFFLIAVSLFLAWTSADKKEKKIVAIVFAVNLALNVLWSYIFFGMRNPFGSFIEIIFLWVSIILMIVICWKINKKASYLLIPYLLWVSFASILNYLMI